MRLEAVGFACELNWPVGSAPTGDGSEPVEGLRWTAGPLFQNGGRASMSPTDAVSGDGTGVRPNILSDCKKEIVTGEPSPTLSGVMPELSEARIIIEVDFALRS